jgi:hypothetical protein
MTRVEGGNEASNCSTFSSGIPTLKEDEEAWTELAIAKEPGTD